jgi:hypothetical protein
MSKHETPMTEAFWEGYARGAYIPEYRIVTPIKDHCSVRFLDAIILPDEPHGWARLEDHDKLAGRNVVVVQTKAKRMGMYLMGQALFSARLVIARGAKSVRSILLCTGADSVLLPLLKPFPEVEVWIYDKNNPDICTRAVEALAARTFIDEVASASEGIILSQ